MKITKLFFAIAIASFLNSCSSEDPEPTVTAPLGKYNSGAFVLNEGSFGSSNASVSFISSDLNTFESSVFDAVNPSTILGDAAQSICLNGDLAYIVLNGSNKIQIVNRYTMKKVGEITSGLNNPRYMVIANGQAFVTNWGETSNTATVPDPTLDDFVAVINLTSNTVSSTISVVEGPERIVANSNTLYVSHKGGFGFGSSVSVINSTTKAIITTIATGDLPSTMQISGGFLWLLCEGKPSYAPSETGGKLQKISLSTNAITDTFSFSLNTDHPSNLDLYNNRLYYTIDKGIYRMSLTPVASIALPTAPIFSTSLQNVYGFAVNSDRIYVSGFNSFSNPGKIEVFAAGESNDPPVGTLLKSQTVGFFPNGFYFN